VAARAPFLRVVAFAVFLLAFATAGCRRSSGKAPAVAHRVVSISASTTETLFAIGAGPQTVGRSRYCDYPKEALALPTVGGYTDPNLEAVLGLTPDLVVGARGPIGQSFVRALEDHGIATYFPQTESFAGILDMITGMGLRTGHDAEATRLVSAMRARKSAIENAVAPLARPRVLLMFASKPVSVAGPGSFTSEMIGLAGGSNVVTQGAAYPVLPLEAVIALDPDVIVQAEMGAAPDLDETWSTVRAVREKMLVRVDDEAVLRPGPRVLDGVVTLARALHPGVVIP
jgi:iron complex transport system substrate-binding protein